MKRIAFLVILGLTLGSCLAGEPASEINRFVCLSYWYHVNVAPCPIDEVDRLKIFRLEDRVDGKGPQVLWNVEGHPAPTIAQLDGCWPQAHAWARDRKTEYDQALSRELKSVVEALVKIANQRLPADKKITAQELKEAIRAELSEP